MNQVLVLPPIAAAAAKIEEPVEQGLISMTGTFIDTIEAAHEKRRGQRFQRLSR